MSLYRSNTFAVTIKTLTMQDLLEQWPHTVTASNSESSAFPSNSVAAPKTNKKQVLDFWLIGRVKG